jgi:hypothetical protein
MIFNTRIKHLLAGMVCFLTSIAAHAQESAILSTFNGVESNGKVLLSWQIIAGSTCDGIRIFHSTDSINYTQVGEIIGVCGSFTEPVNYSFTHDMPHQNGRNYYRLQLGTLGKSPTVVVSLVDTKSAGYQIRPHPVNGAAMLYFENPNQQPHTLTVYNISGRQVEKYYTSTNAFYIQPEGAANGLYLFTIADNKENIKLKGKLLILQ